MPSSRLEVTCQSELAPSNVTYRQSILKSAFTGQLLPRTPTESRQRTPGIPPFFPSPNASDPTKKQPKKQNIPQKGPGKSMNNTNYNENQHALVQKVGTTPNVRAIRASPTVDLHRSSSPTCCFLKMDQDGEPAASPPQPGQDEMEHVVSKLVTSLSNTTATPLDAAGLKAGPDPHNLTRKAQNKLPTSQTQALGFAYCSEGTLGRH